MTAKKMEQHIEELLQELGQQDVLQADMTDAEIEEILAKTPQVLMSADFKKRALIAMRDAQAKRETSKSGSINNLPLDSLIKQAQQIGIRRSELASQLRLGSDILMKLEKRLIKDVPDMLVEMLAGIINVPEEIVRQYFDQEPSEMKIAASSQQQPTGYRTETWEEALETSEMDGVDKAFWLSNS